ncbi:hypothetical protein CN082_32815 [Sinorhizobium meliloti]|nr:hypothetical protein CN082_32815 [Sinorhizobium meliloti]
MAVWHTSDVVAGQRIGRSNITNRHTATYRSIGGYSPRLRSGADYDLLISREFLEVTAAIFALGLIA